MNIYVLASAVHVQQEESDLEKESTYEEVCSEVKQRSDETWGSTDFETHLTSCTDNDAKAGIVLDPSSVKSRKVT